MATTTELLSSSYSALEDHARLMKDVEASHHRRRALLATLPESSLAGIEFPELPARSPSPPSPKPDSRELDPHSERQRRQLERTDLPKEKLEKVKRYQNYVPEEETIRNDYSQQYVDSGEWPQNWVLGAELEKRFEEYPKQHRLLALKQAAVDTQSHPPTHLPLASISSLQGMKFDVILVDPPYADITRDPPYGGIAWDQIAELPIPILAADPSFIFLWVGHGNSDGLERGREVLAKWGFRRCEDIVWVKTNKTSNRGPGTDPHPIGGILTRTTEHCLMGIKGTVRRSSDGWFVHCNIDTDVIIWEGDPTDGLRKPPEMYSLIENFCLGTRRLEVFGRASSLRRGWVTLGDMDDAAYELEKVDGKPWDKEWYENFIKNNAYNGRPVVATTQEIEQLRPKSPHRPDKTNQNQGGAAQSGGPRSGPSGTPNQNTPFSGSPAPMMQGPMSGPGFGGRGPVPIAAAGFDGGFPQGDVGMPMGMVPGMVMNQGMMGGMSGNPGMGGPMNPMSMGPNPVNIPQNAPIRLGGGPMQNMQNMSNQRGGMMGLQGPNMHPNMGGNPMGMRMGNQFPVMGGGVGQPNMMPGIMVNPNMMGMQMGNPQMQMGGMGMGMGPMNMGMGMGMGGMNMGMNNMNMGGGMVGQGMPFNNPNRNWQQGGGNPQQGGWNSGNNF